MKNKLQVVPVVELIMIALLSITPLIAAPAAMSGVMQIWIDDTRSLSASARATTLANVQRQLPAMIVQRSIGTVVVCHFGDDAWGTACAQLLVPTAAPVNCEAPRIPGELSKIKTVREMALQQSEGDCAVRKNKAAKEYASKMEAYVEEVGKAMMTPTASAAPCTSISDVLARLSKNSSRSMDLVLTDGRQTCAASASRIAAPAHPHPVVALVAERSSAAFEESKVALLAMAPWLTAVEPGFVDDIAALFLHLPPGSAAN